MADGIATDINENGEVLVVKENYFNVLNDIDVSGKVEKKNGLTYLSWAFAWGELKKRFPMANYKIYENNDCWNYFTDGRTCWVKVSVTVDSLEHIEYLPVMDYRNNSIPYEKVTSTDVNKAIQRGLTKACARHGVGLYIYAGEDLPEKAKAEKSKKEEFEQKLKDELKVAIRNYAKLTGQAVATVNSQIVAKYGSKITNDSERIISVTDDLREQIAKLYISGDAQ